jgi:transposase
MSIKLTEVDRAKIRAGDKKQWAQIKRALKGADNVKAAAEYLGVNYATLYRWLAMGRKNGWIS